MATTNPIPDVTSPSERTGSGLLVLLAALPPEQLEDVIAKLTSAFPPDDLVIATADPLVAEVHPGLKIIANPVVNASWMLTAADFVNGHQLARKNGARAILMLGPGAGTLGSPALRELGQAVTANSTDLAMARYDLPSRAGLVNSAILYPLSRALFASRIRYPLAIDLGLSPRMAERLAGAGQRFTAMNQTAAPLWPVNEAAVAGFAVNEIDAGPRVLPQPTEPDLNTILPSVTGSLFADIDAKAAFWQRARQIPQARNFTPSGHAHPADAAADITSMLQAFRLAYTNLQEIWSLVLPPNTLLGLKRLSLTDGAAFRMPESLWVRIVYDFLLAYRLRTINRGHLLGALIPLYLAWVASHINVVASGVNPERHIETVAAAFETEKPYIVSRWRWPDRFNP
jgi:glucosylglycerate synthase